MPEPLRKYPEAYPPEYDRLRKLGRHGRTAAENVEFLKLRDSARKAAREAALASRVREMAAAAADTVSGLVPPIVEPEPEREVRGVVPASPDVEDASSGASVDPPIQAAPEGASPPVGEVEVGGDAGEVRGEIPPGPDPGPTPEALERRALALQMLARADAAWAARLHAAGVEMWAPVWLRMAWCGLVVEVADEWGLLDAVELSRTEKTIVAVAGAPVIYGPGVWELYKREKAAKKWNGTGRRVDRKPWTASGEPPASPNIEPEASSPIDSPSASTSPPGMGSSGPGTSPA